MPNGRHVVVTDTVGFIQKLPTTLIAAFRATLEEITEAGVLLHVVDISHPNVLQQIETVEDTLAEIDVPPVPRILVWNKIDLWGDRPLPVYSGAAAYWAEVAVSAREAVGIPALLSVLETTLDSYAVPMKLLLPYQRGDLISALHESATIESQQHTEDGVLMTVQLPPSLAERFKQYRV
jgi:GTP-binding protein HflX